MKLSIPQQKILKELLDSEPWAICKPWPGNRNKQRTLNSLIKAGLIEEVYNNTAYKITKSQEKIVCECKNNFNNLIKYISKVSTREQLLFIDYMMEEILVLKDILLSEYLREKK